MKDRSLIFIYNKKENKFLLLPLVKHLNHQSQGGCFIITGEIKDIKHTREIIKKEIKDKIGLNVEDIFSLNWGSTYKWKNEEFKEMNFIAFVDSNNVKVNEKHPEYKWLNIERFIKKVRCEDSRTLLKKVLEKGINRELYFDKKEREPLN